MTKPKSKSNSSEWKLAWCKKFLFAAMVLSVFVVGCNNKNEEESDVLEEVEKSISSKIVPGMLTSDVDALLSKKMGMKLVVTEKSTQKSSYIYTKTSKPGKYGMYRILYVTIVESQGRVVSIQANYAGMGP
jgi:hypothetical protein